MVAKFFGKFKKTSKPKDPKNGAAPSKTKPIKSKMKPNPKSESLATPTGTPRSTRATPNPAGSATNGKPGKPKSKITLPIIISIILGVIILLMVIAAVLYFVLKPSEEPANVCETPKCVSLAHQLLNWRDEKVDPCDNFYQYTCGKYTEQVNSKHSSMMWKRQLGQGTMTEYIHRIKTPKTKSEYAMKKVLTTCETSSSKNQFWDPDSLSDLFSKIKQVGKFPILDSSFSETEFDASVYLENMAKIFKTHHFGLFKFFFTGKFFIEPEESGRLDIHAVAKTLKTLMTHFQLGSSLLRTYLNQAYTLIVNKLPTDQNSSQEPLKTSINDLNRLFTKVNFDAVLQNSMTAKQYEYIRDKIFIFSSMSKSLKGNLDNLIEKNNKTVLANVLLIFIVNNANRVMGASGECAQSVSYLMPHLSLGIMIRHYFDKKNLEKASEMIDEMKVAFKKMLEESTWLQDSTKKNAVKKLETLKKVVGFSEEFQDPGKFEKIFEKKLQWQNDDSHYTFCHQIDRFTKSMMFDELVNGRLLSTSEIMTSTNAFYAPTLNMLALTVPILDDPLFDASYPKYAQIGSIGSVVGHEIGHSFDPKGSKFDENGNYRDWWTSKDTAEFQRRTQCVINKYENFDDPVFGRNQLNGTIASGENVADLLGARVSWDILKNVDASKEPKLVGLQDHSIDKLFFQIMAMMYCSPHNTNPLMLYNMDPHAPHNYRVNGVFSNMKQFAETFDCPVGSKMNPATKCDLF